MANENYGKKFKMGALTLRAHDLSAVLSFYENDLGLKQIKKNENTAELGAPGGERPLLLLREDPNAASPAQYSAGLYHYAILVHNRTSLASAYLALGNRGVYFEGFADHLVSESLYLKDPEGNGIEIYRDRPREEWTFDSSGQLKMDVLPIDFDSMILELSKNNPALRKNPIPFPEGARIGHLHLKVTNLEASRDFYHERLGMDVMINRMGGASFLSYEGYHHHLGMNTWESLGGSPHNNEEIGLESFAIETTDKEFIDGIESKEEMSDRASLLQSEKHDLVISDPDSINVVIRLVDWA